MGTTAGSVVVRAEAAADRAAVRALIESAFEDEGRLVADLVDVLRAHPCGRDGLGFVAVDDGAVVGYVLVTRSRLDTLPRTVEVAVLSPLGVERGHRGRGVGRLLIERAVEASTDVGLPALFLEGDPAFYVRHGFVPAKPLGFRKPSIRIPDDAFQVMLLPGHEPWMTGTLVYAEPFWDLDAVGLRGPDFLAWLATEVAEGRQL
jgi:putative acetyltransferase